MAIHHCWSLATVPRAVPIPTPPSSVKNSHACRLNTRREWSRVMLVSVMLVLSLMRWLWSAASIVPSSPRLSPLSPIPMNATAAITSPGMPLLVSVNSSVRILPTQRVWQSLPISVHAWLVLCGAMRGMSVCVLSSCSHWGDRVSASITTMWMQPPIPAWPTAVW